MSKIYYTPFTNSLNAYTERMKSILSVYGDIKRIDKNALFNKILNFDFNDIIVVNWLENIMIDKKGEISFLGVIKVFIIFICFRCLFKKFIYVRHNHYPHACNKEKSKKAKKILDVLEQIAHVTVVHSPVEAKGSRIYIPHPLYNIESIQNKKNNSTFVIFGSISRYKKIENVILNFPKNLSLLIMGKCDDDEYLKELMKIKESKPNVNIKSDYISDEMANKLISDSAGLLITHNDDDMIVSGSFFYAMSIECKTFVLNTPFFKWASEEIGDDYIKCFKNLDDMFSNLILESDVDLFNNGNNPKDLFSDEMIMDKFDKILN